MHKIGILIFRSFYNISHPDRNEWQELMCRCSLEQTVQILLQILRRIVDQQQNPLFSVFKGNILVMDPLGTAFRHHFQMPAFPDILFCSVWHMQRYA